jgi:hypothetical protein
MAKGWTAGILLGLFLAEQEFYLRCSVQIGSGAHLTSRVPGVLSPELKRPGYEAGHSPPSSAEDRNGGAILPLPHTSLWRGAHLIEHRNDFTFLDSIQTLFMGTDSCTRLLIARKVTQNNHFKFRVLATFSG